MEASALMGKWEEMTSRAYSALLPDYYQATGLTSFDRIMCIYMSSLMFLLFDNLQLTAVIKQM